MKPDCRYNDLSYNTLCVETLSSRLRLIVLRTRLPLVKASVRCGSGRLKQAAIKRLLHSACVPLIDSPLFFRYHRTVWCEAYVTK